MILFYKWYHLESCLLEKKKEAERAASSKIEQVIKIEGPVIVNGTTISIPSNLNLFVY